MKNASLFLAGFLVACRWFRAGANAAPSPGTTPRRLPPVNRPDNFDKSSGAFTGGWPATLHLAHLKKSLGVVALLITLVSISLTSCEEEDKEVMPFALTSPEITTTLTQAQYANAFGGCTGENRSPALQWQNPPSGTQSYAVTIFDRDANGGAGFNHWLLIDIPLATKELRQDAGNFSGAKLPLGAMQTTTDAMLAGYVGVCPPVGETHHYVITVYAVREPSLGLAKEALPATVKAALAINSLATATFTVTATH